MAGHAGLRYRVSYLWEAYSSIKNLIITSNFRVYRLWKTVEIEEKPVRTCSGCAGDYEDPDRTVWEEDAEEEVEEVGNERADAE